MWIEKIDGNQDSPSWFVQIFPDKTATLLMSIALVIYPLQAVLRTVPLRRGKCLVGDVHLLVGFLLVCYSDYQLGLGLLRGCHWRVAYMLR